METPRDRGYFTSAIYDSDNTTYFRAKTSQIYHYKQTQMVVILSISVYAHISLEVESSLT